MAYHRKLKLCSLKVTHHSLKETREVHRGQVDNADTCSIELPEHTSMAATPESEHTDELSTDMPDLYNEDDDPTLHELHQKATVSAWENLRSNILAIATESGAMPFEQVCMVCNTSAKFKCERCGPNIFYCFNCFCKQHETANFFHVAEEWEV